MWINKDADDNAIKTVNLCVKSLSDNCELSDIFVFKKNQNYFNIPDKCIARLWWPLIEAVSKAQTLGCFPTGFPST